MGDFKILLAEAALALLLNATAGLIGRDTAITVTKWGWVLFALHASFLVASTHRPIRFLFRFKVSTGRFRNAMSYLIVAIIGALLAMLYWRGVNAAYDRFFPPTIKITFSDSPLFTDSRQSFISTEFDGMRKYLIDLGFQVPEMVPPIQLSQHRGMISGPSDYSYTIMLHESELDDRLSLRSDYSNFAFQQMSEVAKKPLYDVMFISTFSRQLSTYFTSSYSQTDYSSHRGWDAILWKLRGQLGQNMLDHALFYSFKLLDQIPQPPIETHGETSWSISDETMDRYLKACLERGLLTMDNPGVQTWKPKLDHIIAEVRSAEAIPSSSEEKK